MFMLAQGKVGIDQEKTSLSGGSLPNDTGQATL